MALGVASRFQADLALESVQLTDALQEPVAARVVHCRLTKLAQHVGRPAVGQSR